MPTDYSASYTTSLMAAAEGPVAEFSRFANFEEKKRKSNLLMSFPKTVNQMGSFGQIRKNSIFCFCRPILDIFGFTLLKYWVKGNKFLNPFLEQIFFICVKFNGTKCYFVLSQ